MEKIDRLGAAAKYSAMHGGGTLPEADDATRQRVRDAISQAISEGLGVPALGRLLRQIIPGLTVRRAQEIAAYEMGVAFAEASLEKMRQTGVAYKQVITAPDACEMCLANKAQNPIPVEQAFQSGQMAAQFHLGCRCTITGARPPKEYVSPTRRAKS